MGGYTPLTVEQVTASANHARERGLTELAEVFDSIAAKLAAFNERSPHTAEELRRHIGEDRFWALLGLGHGVRP